MTHDFTPDWKLSQQDQLQVHLSIALAKHVPGWPGATDEQLAAVAADLSPIGYNSQKSPFGDTGNVFEAKARDLLLDAFTKNGAEERDGTITFEFKIADLQSDIAAALKGWRNGSAVRRSRPISSKGCRMNL